MDNDSSTRGFEWMSIWFGVGHAVVTTPLVLASTLLPHSIGLAGNAVLYAATLVSTLLLSVPIVTYTGVWGGIRLGIGLYVVYSLFFTLALFASGNEERQWVLFSVGSSIGGIAASVLWTSQGSFFTRVASIAAHDATAGGSGDRRQDATGDDSQQASVEEQRRKGENSRLASIFAFWYLLTEVVAKLGVSVLQTVMSDICVSAAYTVVGAAALFFLDKTPDLLHESDEDQIERRGGGTMKKLLDVVRLWRVPELWMLAFTNITFGLSSAYLTGYFNSARTEPELGEKYIGVCAALTVAVATLLSRPYGALAQRFSKDAALCAGAASFAGISAMALAPSCCRGWGPGLFVFYVLQGSGRAVYESTNKAIFADFFEGANTEAAFANCYIQFAASSVACFFLSDFKHMFKYLPWAILCCALLTPVFFVAAEAYRQRMKTPGERTPLVAPGAASDA